MNFELTMEKHYLIITQNNSIPFQGDIVLWVITACLCCTSHKQFPAVKHQSYKYLLSLLLDHVWHTQVLDNLYINQTRVPEHVKTTKYKFLLFSSFELFKSILHSYVTQTLRISLKTLVQTIQHGHGCEYLDTLIWCKFTKIKKLTYLTPGQLPVS